MLTENKKGISTASRDAVIEELVAELRYLRAAVREMGARYVLRAEGEIEYVIGNLDCVPTSLLKERSPGWLREIRGLKLKPAKGRLKDLKGIDRLTDLLLDEVIVAQDGKKTL
ncbi:MAG TPA: hypothetical protein VL949_11090 [Geobacteraceae bacterium]|nr:hypothetical protein [Geobacteraceae bacterium]